METHYAPAERATPLELQKEIEIVSNNAIINELLFVVSGLLAVLNEQRQILAVNEAFIKELGIGNAEELMGLRPGEAIHCIHAHEMPGGCGTSESCLTCGAAISIVVSLTQDAPVEKTCAITVDRKGQREDIYFKVRSCPTRFAGQRMVLLFLRDITNEQKWAKLEQVLFHDINNSLAALLNASDLLIKQIGEKKDIEKMICQVANRIAREIELQKCISYIESCNYKIDKNELSVAQIFQEIESIFSNHSVAQHKLLMIPTEFPDITFKTDFTLLMRVLNNMLLNAFEASHEGDQVKVSFEQSPGTITFAVWNRQAIPADVAKRIFQRNFSTKGDLGRGLGTFAMKFFGEGFLGGKVDFSTSESEGTVFRFSLQV
jgi:signal transduction histidine kinase